MKKLIIFGNGQVADIMFSYFQENNEYKVVAFCVDDKFQSKKKHLNLTLLPLSKLKNICTSNDYFIFVDIYYTQMNKKKKNKDNQRKKMEYQIENLINANKKMTKNIKIEKNVAI